MLSRALASDVFLYQRLKKELSFYSLEWLADKCYYALPVEGSKEW